MIENNRIGSLLKNNGRNFGECKNRVIGKFLSIIYKFPGCGVRVGYVPNLHTRHYKCIECYN